MCPYRCEDKYYPLKSGKDPKLKQKYEIYIKLKIQCQICKSLVELGNL